MRRKKEKDNVIEREDKVKKREKGIDSNRKAE